MPASWPLPADHVAGEPGFIAGINQLETNMNDLHERDVEKVVKPVPGSDGAVLVADSGEPGGVRWGAVDPGGPGDTSTAALVAGPSDTHDALTGRFARGTYFPQDYGAITYGPGVSSAAAAANAVAIQGAIDACAVNGGTVRISGLIEVRSAGASALVLKSGVHLVGDGIGGDVFSGSDALLPFKGTVLRLNAGANQDVIGTQNFATLTGDTTPDPYDTPSRFGFHHLVIDGNKAGNSAGRGLTIYGRSYEVDGLIVQNCTSGGVYSEWGAGGYEMESRWSNFTITDNGGDGLEWRGPHDSQFMNGLVARNDNHRGIYVVPGAQVGGEMFANVHVWGSHSRQWVLGGTNSAFLNCVSDGPGGVQLIGSGNQWLGGSIFGTNVHGEVAIVIGDGTARTVANNVIQTRVYNYAKGSMLTQLTANTTPQKNVYRINATMSSNTRYAGGQGYSTLASGATLPTGTLTLVDASSFPASGSLYIGDGAAVAALSYTGKSGNQLTGVAGGTGAFAAGASIWSLSGSASSDTWEVTEPDQGGFFQTAQTSLVTRTFLEPTSFNVNPQTLRPNSSTTALQHMRNETGRVDMQWDNSGTVGRYVWGAFHDLREQAADPANPAADTARLFARDNGSGKTQLCALFPTGAVVVIATEP